MAEFIGDVGDDLLAFPADRIVPTSQHKRK